MTDDLPLPGDVVNMQWLGDVTGAEGPAFREFISWGQLATPRLIWWIEPDLSGLCDLLFTQELTHAPPHRVRPFEWCHRVGGLYAPGWYDQVAHVDRPHPMPGRWMAREQLFPMLPERPS